MNIRYVLIIVLTLTGVYFLNATERAIHELEVYKTPLLPTRLQGSHTVPDMFRRKLANAPVLMEDRDRKPRLGSAERSVATAPPEESPIKKPYAGSGGMKKLLAKRRMEEQEEQEKERTSRIETDEEDVESNRQTQQKMSVAELRAPIAQPNTESPVKSIPGREQSSLRVGRTRMHRTHAVSIKPRSQAGRFSAIFEEEDEAMDDTGRISELKELEAVAQKAPAFNVPLDFSFAKDVSISTLISYFHCSSLNRLRP